MSYIFRDGEVSARYDGGDVQADFIGFQPVSYSDEEAAGVENVERTSLTILGVDITDAQVKAFPQALRDAIGRLDHEVEWEGV